MVFNPQCRGTRRNSKTYWCEPCEPLADKNCTLSPTRLVKAVSEKFTQTNKQYLLQHRCKRLKLNDDQIICYVLETAENAHAVAATEGLELLTKEDYDGEEITYHWSGKHKKYLHGPRPSARTPSIQCKAPGCSQPGNRSCQFEYCYVDCIERQKQIRESQHIALSLGHRPSHMETPKCVVHQPKKRKRSSASSNGSGLSGPTSPVFRHPGEDLLLGLSGRPRQRRATLPGVLGPFAGLPGAPHGAFPPGFNPFNVPPGLVGSNHLSTLAQQVSKEFAADPAALAFLGLAPNAFAPKHMSSGAIGANATNGLLASASGAALGSMPPQGRRNTMPTMPAWPYPGAPVLPFHAPGQAPAAGHGNPANDAVLKATIDAMMGANPGSSGQLQKLLQMSRRGSTGALGNDRRAPDVGGAAAAAVAAAAAAASGSGMPDFQRRHSHSHSSSASSSYGMRMPAAFSSHSRPPTISEEQLIDDETMKSDSEVMASKSQRHRHTHHHHQQQQPDHDMLDAASVTSVSSLSSRGSAAATATSTDTRMKMEPDASSPEAEPPTSSPHTRHPHSHHNHSHSMHNGHNGAHRGSDASIVTASGDSRRSSSSSELNGVNGASGRRSSTSSHASVSSHHSHQSSSSPRGRASGGNMPTSMDDVAALLSGGAGPAGSGGSGSGDPYGNGPRQAFSPHAPHASTNGLQHAHSGSPQAPHGTLNGGLQKQHSQSIPSPFNARSPTDDTLSSMLKAHFPAGLGGANEALMQTLGGMDTSRAMERPPSNMISPRQQIRDGMLNSYFKCDSPSNLSSVAAAAASGNSAPTSPMVTDHHQPHSPTSSSPGAASFSNPALPPEAAVFSAAAQSLAATSGGGGSGSHSHSHGDHPQFMPFGSHGHSGMVGSGIINSM